jgi:hypothetical protein
MRSTNPLTQKVNFFISATFIAVFGIFLTSKILDVAQADDPIKDAVAATQQALQN